MPIEPGTLIGPYEVTGTLGVGGMGEVYRARDSRIGRDVAIKILPADLAASPERLSRFALEAKTTGSLNHPNLLVIFDLGTHQNTPYLVTELLEGETLRERIDRGTVSARKAIEWATQIAEGVAAAHEKGVIHRDIKPENIFLSANGRLKLLDFGLAKLMADDPVDDREADTFMRHTDPGVVLGTPAYMAPEQVRGEPIDERADIFALGIVLAELATGTHPFHRPTRVETMNAILNAEPTLPDSLPANLARIIDHMLARSVSARFQSMKDVVFSLNLLSGSHSSAELSMSTRSVSSAKPVAREFVTLTLRRGRILNARFSPDGNVFFSASWEGDPVAIFLNTPGRLEAISIGTPGTELHSVAPSGDLAVSLDRSFLGGWVSTGTLARMRHSGGAPRKIHEHVVDADWSPDGKTMAIIRHADDGTFVLEYPIGRPLRVSDGWLSRVRFSRDGTRLAFMDHPWFGDDAGHPVVIDLEGREIMVPEGICSTTSGLAWSPDGDEIWFAGERDGLGRDLLGYDMSGTRRLVLSAPGQLSLFDTRPDGAILLTHDTWRREAYAGRRGQPPSKNLAWFDWPHVTAISADGSEILFEEQRAEEDGLGTAFFLRSTDGGPAVHVGNGRARALSPDGKWIAADTGVAGHLELIPTGVGESKLVKCQEFSNASWWEWYADGKRLLVVGAGTGHSRFARELSLENGEAREIGPGNLRWPCATSPDGEHVIALSPDDQLMIYPTRGANGVAVPGARRGEWPICWSDDAKYLYVFPRGCTSLSIDRLDLTTGERVVWQQLHPSDSAGIVDIHPVWITRDGEHYAYSYRRCLSDLYMVTSPTNS